jgi:hypothetical protein
MSDAGFWHVSDALAATANVDCNRILPLHRSRTEPEKLICSRMNRDTRRRNGGAALMRERPIVQVLTTVTFVYAMREDRILAAINPGRPEAWSCWLTRRVVLALLERLAELLANTSALAQRAPAEVRGELVAFEHEAAMAKTAERMTRTPAEALNASATAAELVDRLSISNQGDNFRVELRGISGGGAVGVLARVGLERVLQMLHDEVAKAGWLATPAKPQPAQTAEEPGSKPIRH